MSSPFRSIVRILLPDWPVRPADCQARPAVYEALEDRRLFSASAATKVYVPTATTVMRAGPKGRITSSAAGGYVQRIAPDKVAVGKGTRAVSPNANLPGYQIEIRFPDDSLSTTQKAVFTAAAARWQSIILGDLPAVTFNFFGTGTETVDDLVIQATAPSIDGVGGTLGSAGPTYTRTGSSLPITGKMRFDSADIANLESSGQLNDVILHEMGHVLGLGTIWGTLGLISGSGGTDPRFTGAQATAQYQAIFGVSTTSVPVENTGAAGTRDGHWREGGGAGVAFGNELMTGYLNSGVANPLSRITIGQYVDLGYSSVNLNAFDLFTPPNGGNAYPTVASLTDSPDPAPTNSSFTLTANGVADSDGSVGSVRFYRETNGIAGLQVLAGTVGDVVADTLVSTDTTAGDGFTAAVPTTGLTDGTTYTYYAQATDNQNLVSVNATTTHTVSVPVTSVQSVTIDDGTVQRSRVRSVTVTLSGTVAAGNIAAGAFALSRTGGSTPTLSVASVMPISGGRTAVVLAFGGTGVVAGSVADGNYQLTINGALITDSLGLTVDAAGTAVRGSVSTVGFYRLFGDNDGDRGVSINDFNAFATAFASSSGTANFIGAFDYDGDNGISINDFNQFTRRFGFAV